MTVANKTVLITGASSGIGEAAAHAFAKAGARLLISARTEAKLVALKSTLEKEYAAKVHILLMDVSNRKVVSQVLTTLPEDWNKIDILVNNAGLALGLETIQDGNMDDWDQMIDTNVKGLLYVSHFVLKIMVARNRGHVINIGSTSGYSVYSGGVAYCATKYAVRAISEGMKMDVHETKIRVTEINPGMVDTQFSTVRFKGDRERADNVYKGFDALQASDIAAAIIYAVNAPQHVNVRQMLITPTAQTANGMIYREDD
jgi:hypothetical protein